MCGIVEMCSVCYRVNDIVFVDKHWTFLQLHVYMCNIKYLLHQANNNE